MRQELLELQDHLARVIKNAEGGSRETGLTVKQFDQLLKMDVLLYDIMETYGTD